MIEKGATNVILALKVLTRNRFQVASVLNGIQYTNVLSEVNI